jgi:hypothetical protein
MPGSRGSRYSAKTIAPRETVAQVEIQSFQPTTNPGYSPRPRRTNTYCPRFGHHRARFGQGDCPDERVQTADDPHAEKEGRARQPGGHVARCAKDPD